MEERQPYLFPLRVDPKTPLQNSTQENSTDIDNQSEDQNLPLDDLNQPSTTQQQNRVLSVFDNWEKVQEKLLSSCIEDQQLPENVKCVNCQDGIATTRCEYCGPHQGPVPQKPINANSGLKTNQAFYFSTAKCCSTQIFGRTLYEKTSILKNKNKQKKLSTKSRKRETKVYANPGLS